MRLVFCLIYKKLLTYNTAMPRRKERQEMKTKLVAVFMEPSVYERLRVEAFEQRCSVGEVVRRAVGAYMGRQAQRRARKGSKR